jgi:dihydrofolate reductase
MITLIAAVAKNGCIGKDGKLAWHNKEDMARFKKLTTSKTVLMGRKTWESIPKSFRPLPDRVNAVITRQTEYALPEGVLRFSSVEEALEALRDREVFVLGGAEIYAATLASADCLELTEITSELEGDTFFPSFDRSAWKETARIDREGFSWVTYQRK